MQRVEEKQAFAREGEGGRGEAEAGRVRGQARGEGVEGAHEGEEVEVGAQRILEAFLRGYG